MMKKILIFSLIYCSLTVGAFCQFTCVIDEGGLKRTGPIVDSDDYIPGINTPIKHIRINFHFMLFEDTHPDAPGNFTKMDDGRGNTNFTGYDWIDDLVQTTNQRLASNTQMTYPLGNNTPVIERKYRLVLNGVFFHKDDYYYYYSHSPQATYNANPGEALNVYYQSDPVGAIQSRGKANMAGDRYCRFANKWGKYNDYYIDQGSFIGNWSNAGGLMHETGHNLSLYHTVMTNGGSCCYSYNYGCNDYCEDTPTREYVISVDGIDPCQPSQWKNSLNSNNIMEYAGYSAITPQQLGRVHWTIENEMSAYQPCSFQNSSASTTSFTDNQAYIAETVTIPGMSNIVIEDNSALYVNCEDFIIYGTIEVEPGSLLVVNTVTSCN